MGDGVSWRYVNATAAGTSHRRAQTPCQDECYAAIVASGHEEVLIAITADGAGYASRAEEGSGLACEVFVCEAEAWLRGGGTIETLTRETAERWIVTMREAIAARATAESLTPRDFACTLVAAVAGASHAAFLQIGDGAIVAGGSGAREVIFWPDAGEYANMTYFVTDEDWPKHLHFELRANAYDELALMTDGLQRLALHFESRSPHAPFFDPMIRALANAPAGYATALEKPLVAFLESDAVSARTDDDKSLVLATRRTGDANGAV